MAIFGEKSDGLYRNIDDLDIPVKTVKFSCKNQQIFLKKKSKIAGNVFNFFRKILHFFEDNLPIYTGKFNSIFGKMR